MALPRVTLLGAEERTTPKMDGSQPHTLASSTTASVKYAGEARAVARSTVPGVGSRTSYGRWSVSAGEAAVALVRLRRGGSRACTTHHGSGVRGFGGGGGGDEGNEGGGTAGDRASTMLARTAGDRASTMLARMSTGLFGEMDMDTKIPGASRAEPYAPSSMAN